MADLLLAGMTLALQVVVLGALAPRLAGWRADLAATAAVLAQLQRTRASLARPHQPVVRQCDSASLLVRRRFFRLYRLLRAVEWGRLESRRMAPTYKARAERAQGRAR